MPFPRHAAAHAATHITQEVVVLTPAPLLTARRGVSRCGAMRKFVLLSNTGVYDVHDNGKGYGDTTSWSYPFDISLSLISFVSCVTP